MRIKKVLESTLLGSIALIGFIFLISIFDESVWKELAEDGWFHIIYSLVLIVPFLAVLFFIISIVVHLLQRLNTRIPVILIPFLITV